jgi:DNA-nicking Smr family endonuclease
VVHRRRLAPEEEELWRSVAQTARPMHPPPRAAPTVFDPPPVLHEQPRQPAPIPAFRLGEKAETRPRGHDLAPSITEGLSAAPVQMDRKAFNAMTRGRRAPEARLDLHGMTLAEAQPDLVRFILRAQAQGLRLVLVITGKGKLCDEGAPMPLRVGVLRHAVPQWLSMPPLSGAVLQVAQAHRRHGGEGALYVYLRRPR